MNPESADPKKPEETKDEGKREEQALRLRTVRPAIGEGRDNLRRRAEWFQRQTGKKP